MSHEQFLYVFINPVYCHLCGTSIEMILAQPIHGEDQWRGWAQELSLEAGNDNGPSKLV